MKLVLFDIDGTLCQPMGTLPQSTRLCLQRLRDTPGFHVGVVGGSDRAKALHQLGAEVMDGFLDHAFSENGCVYYRHGRVVSEERLEDHVDPSTLNELITFLMRWLADCDVPWRTGQFIERRSCMLNVSPIGRACTQQQREQFFAWDKQSRCRERLVAAIRDAFPALPLEIAIGGMISIDMFPHGLNKTRCLKHLLGKYEEIHFVGDRVDPEGNDYHLYISPHVIGHKTTGPVETEEIILRIVSA